PPPPLQPTVAARHRASQQQRHRRIARHRIVLLRGRKREERQDESRPAQTQQPCPRRPVATAVLHPHRRMAPLFPQRPPHSPQRNRDRQRQHHIRNQDAREKKQSYPRP